MVKDAQLVPSVVIRYARPPTKMNEKGLVQVYTGEGKGKTTAALGLALRALGWGKKVLFVQFLKKGEFGEIKAAQKFPFLEIRQFGTGEFVDLKSLPHEVVERSRAGWDFAKKEALEGDWNLLILDEINLLLGAKILLWEEIEEFLEARPRALEIVFTGRNAPKQLLNKADLVTEFRKIKHPFDLGACARKGIEW